MPVWCGLFVIVSCCVWNLFAATGGVSSCSWWSTFAVCVIVLFVSGDGFCFGLFCLVVEVARGRCGQASAPRRVNLSCLFFFVVAQWVGRSQGAISVR